MPPVAIRSHRRRRETRAPRPHQGHRIGQGEDRQDRRAHPCAPPASRPHPGGLGTAPFRARTERTWVPLLALRRNATHHRQERTSPTCSLGKNCAFLYSISSGEPARSGLKRCRAAGAHPGLITLLLDQSRRPTPTWLFSPPGCMNCSTGTENVIYSMTIPGVGFITAATLTAEVGGWSRFSSARQLSADFGIIPSARALGTVAHYGHITELQALYARRALVEAAHTAKKSRPGRSATTTSCWSSAWRRRSPSSPRPCSYWNCPGTSCTNGRRSRRCERRARCARWRASTRPSAQLARSG